MRRPLLGALYQVPGVAAGAALSYKAKQFNVSEIEWSQRPVSLISEGLVHCYTNNKVAADPGAADPWEATVVAISLGAAAQAVVVVRLHQTLRNFCAVDRSAYVGFCLMDWTI